MAELPKGMQHALKAAARRERGNICPIIGVHGAAEDALIAAMEVRGFIVWDGRAPRISQAGRDAAAELLKGGA